jgi:hypothetical protein
MIVVRVYAENPIMTDWRGNCGHRHRDSGAEYTDARGKPNKMCRIEGKEVEK